MSWYGARMDASAFGHSMPSFTGEGGTYFDRQAANDTLAADYRTKHLNAWLRQIYAMEGKDEQV